MNSAGCHNMALGMAPSRVPCHGTPEAFEARERCKWAAWLLQTSFKVVEESESKFVRTLTNFVVCLTGAHLQDSRKLHEAMHRYWGLMRMLESSCNGQNANPGALFGVSE